MPKELVTIPELASMPELVRDGSMGAGGRSTPNPETTPPKKNYPPETSPVIESGYGKHDEGGALSRHARSCVEAVRQR